MIEEVNGYSSSLANDAINELLNVGLGKAAKVISEMADSHIKLGVITIYPLTDTRELELFPQYSVIQEVKGEILNGKTLFSMVDNELLKLLRHMEVIDATSFNADNLDLILDSYHEIGNIILGNILSTMADYLCVRVEILLPYLSERKRTLNDFKGKSYLIANIVFLVEALNIDAKVCFIFDEHVHEKIALKLINNAVEYE